MQVANAPERMANVEEMATVGRPAVQLVTNVWSVTNGTLSVDLYQLALRRVVTTLMGNVEELDTLVPRVALQDINVLMEMRITRSAYLAQAHHRRQPQLQRLHLHQHLHQHQLLPHRDLAQMGLGLNVMDRIFKELSVAKAATLVSMETNGTVNVNQVQVQHQPLHQPRHLHPRQVLLLLQLQHPHQHLLQLQHHLHHLHLHRVHSTMLRY